MNYRHFLLSGSLAVTSFTAVSVIASTTRAGTIVTQLPIIFNNNVGMSGTDFTVDNATPGNIDARLLPTITTPVSVGTEPLILANNPVVILANFLEARTIGGFGYTSTDPGAIFQFDLIADGVSVFDRKLASGLDGGFSSFFDEDLTAFILANASKSLSLRFQLDSPILNVNGNIFADGNLTDVQFLITTAAVPEPGSGLALGFLGAGLAVVSVRKKWTNKTKTKL
jgi:PEP-CTERM motif